MHINKISAIQTIALVAKELDEDPDWLADIATEMEPEDGVIRVYDPGPDDQTMAFSDFGVENLVNLVGIHRRMEK